MKAEYIASSGRPPYDTKKEWCYLCLCSRERAPLLESKQLSSMASSYNSLVAHQLQDTRPSPTLEVSKTLDVSSSYSPGHTPCPSFGPSASSSSSSHRKDYFEAAASSKMNTSTAMTEQQQQQQSYTRPNSQVLDPVAPPCTPITSPLRRTVTASTTTTTTNTNERIINTTPVATSKHQRVASQNGLPSIQVTRTPTSGVLSQPLASSPKGVSDVFSLSSDRQLSAQYWFHEEIGYGNWVSHSITLHRIPLSSVTADLSSVFPTSLTGLRLEDSAMQRSEARTGSQVNLSYKGRQDNTS